MTMPVLVVAGTVRNVTAAPVEVPRLRLALRNVKGGEVYAWAAIPDQAVLEPGQTEAFRSRLASPPEGQEVLVRFVNRLDRLAADR